MTTWHFDADGDGYSEQILTDFDGDGIADVVQIDTDLDGKADFAAYDTDGDGTADEFRFDLNRDGTYDSYGYDKDQDGVWDTGIQVDPNHDGIDEAVWFDTNGDGVPDQVWFDTDGDGQVDVAWVGTDNPAGYRVYVNDRGQWLEGSSQREVPPPTPSRSPRCRPILFGNCSTSGTAPASSGVARPKSGNEPRRRPTSRVRGRAYRNPGRAVTDISADKYGEAYLTGVH